MADKTVERIIYEVGQVCDRYKWRDDIERGLMDLHFDEIFADRDDYIYLHKEGKVLLFISWVNATCQIFIQNSEVRL